MLSDLLNKVDISNGVIVAVSVGLIVVFGLILILGSRRNAKQKELQMILTRKKQEEDLVQKLKNKDGETNLIQEHPYEITYEAGDQSSDNNTEISDSTTAVRVQLILKTSLAKKKYVLEIRDCIFIGRSKDNGIVLEDKNVSSKHCVLLNRGGEIYVQDLDSTNGTGLSRKKSFIQVGANPTKLKSKDVLIIAENEIEIYLI